MAGDGSTITTIADRDGDAGTTLAPALFLVLDSAQPRAGSARYALVDADAVAIGRGKRRRPERRTAGADRVIHIEIPDGRMSSEHARLEYALGKWVITDAASKNGTIVNGKRADRTALADGDVIELGRTFLRFRAGVAPADDAAFVDAAQVATPAPGMRTLVPRLARAFSELARVAASEISVVLAGETGTGKEVMARAVHALSGRKGRFVAVNCGAIAPNLVESELFGHVKGAFSGADADKPGHVRAADGGTLFLDEIGDLPPTSQAALLRVLQEREVTPVGSSTPVSVDLRVVCATHRDLTALVENRAFRADLLARLAGHRFELPPLRERLEDLGILVAELLPDGVSLSREATRALFAYDWPMNIRELQKCLETAAALATGDTIEAEHLPDAMRDALLREPAPPRELSAEDAALKQRIIDLLAQHSGNVSAVARDLDKARPQVHRWLKRFAIDPDEFR